MSAKDKDQEPGTFMIQACRCRRCGGLLTSKESVRNGIGHVCRLPHEGSSGNAGPEPGNGF